MAAMARSALVRFNILNIVCVRNNRATFNISSLNYESNSLLEL